MPKRHRKTSRLRSTRKPFFLIDTIYYHGSITPVIMKRPRIFRLGDLQLRIMQVLWQQSEASVSDVHRVVSPQRELAYTTVATMLRKMEAKGLVGHRLEGRSFIYRAAVAEETVSKGMSEHLLEKLFAGSLSEMVNHLLSSREVSRDELSKLEHLIAERKKGK